ncbi:MAG: hypothetical protein HW391_1910 [Chloroflexi bacterium]|nr:hypothetical protein [Chloroflexota bacterium]
MSLTPGSFRPDELVGADSAPGDADLATAWATARDLENSLKLEAIAPSAGFADRVMAAVALEPAPRRGGFLVPLRVQPGLAGFLTSVREAWAVASGGAGRPAAARGMALAYVLAVVLIGASLSGMAAYGTAGALGLLGDDASPSPSIVLPSPLPSPSATPQHSSPSASPSPASPGPGESGEAGQTGAPGGTDQPGASASSGPGASPGQTDAGGSPDPSPDGSSSPDPSETPDPSDTPKPSETPH